MGGSKAFEQGFNDTIVKIAGDIEKNNRYAPLSSLVYGLLGAGAGALIDRKKRKRGALLGGLLGALAGVPVDLQEFNSSRWMSKEFGRSHGRTAEYRRRRAENKNNLTADERLFRSKIKSPMDIAGMLGPHPKSRDTRTRESDAEIRRLKEEAANGSVYANSALKGMEDKIMEDVLYELKELSHDKKRPNSILIR